VSGQYAGKDIVLLNTTPLQLYSANVSFAGGSRLVFGDSSSAQNDNGANNLVGTAGRDHLSGFGGNDMLDGGAGADDMNGGSGNDTYIVTAGDVLADSAASTTS
jgi:Ca2+-binding RTX toxin-like protein